MGARGLVRYLLVAGARPDAPPSERKHIVFVNALALGAIGMALLFAPMQVVYGDATTLAAYVATPLAFGGVLVLNGRGHTTLAGAALCVGAWAVTSAQAAIDPNEGAIHFFLLVLIILPYLALPRRAWLLTFALAGLLAGTFLAFIYAEDAARAADPTLYLWTMAGAALAVAVAGHYARYATSRAEDELEDERRRADALLHNTLPVPIAERLKRGDDHIADEFPDVSILFLDIVGFTRLATEISADDLVRRLNAVMCAFDRIALRRGVEKIKTIGDGYMVAAGVPTPRADHARVLCEVALEMRETMASLPEAAGLSARVGVHSGPAVGGVIGEAKFVYDLWGDTVNTAAKLEEFGVPGEIQISGATRERLGGHCEVEERGLLDIPGKGRIRAYLLSGPAGPTGSARPSA